MGLLVGTEAFIDQIHIRTNYVTRMSKFMRIAAKTAIESSKPQAAGALVPAAINDHPVTSTVAGSRDINPREDVD